MSASVAVISIGHAFRLKRMSLGLDRRQLAEVLEVTPGWIKHIEIGLKPPGESLVKALDTLAAKADSHPVMGHSGFTNLLKRDNVTPFDIAVLTRYQAANLTLAQIIKNLEAGE